jgi:ATP-dependent helicase/nuclease subunit A
MSVEAAARDRAARHAAQTEFARPIVLEAGAGTGKTTALVSRVVLWCLGPGWERAAAALAARTRTGAAGPSRGEVAARVASRVVAITFTEAAAAQMAREVGQALALVAAGDPDGKLRAVLTTPLPGAEEERRLRARALLASLDRVGVRTIHAFCQRLLASHPIEAGLHPQLVVDADGSRLEDAVREVLEHWLVSEARPADAADRIALAAGRVGPEALGEALVALVASGVEAADLAAPAFTAAFAADAGARLRAAAEGFLAVAGEPLLAQRDTKRGAPGGKQLALAAEATARVLATPLDLERYAAGRDEIARQWSDTAESRLECFAEGELNQTEEKLLGAVREDLRAAAAALRERWRELACFDPARFELARRVLGPLVGAVRERLRCAGVLGFDAILRSTARLLRGNEGVARQERGAIDQLLVDEFQDTDHVQCEIVRTLALAGPKAERPGLFLVGDPKQSIYGWRSADLRAYAAMVAEVASAGGVRHELCVNFRSAPPILDEVARLLAGVLVAREGVQPPFQVLLPCDERRGDAGFAAAHARPVEHWVPCAIGDDGAPESTNARHAVEIEADAVAADIRRLHDGASVDWRHVAILLRSFSDVDAVLDALRRHRVPYEVGKDRSYYRRREVIEAAALVRCVIDPNDQLALVAWLRSAAVGVPDAAWIPLFASDLARGIAELQWPDPERLARLRALVHDAAAAVPPGVPGLERVAAWPVALAAALESLAVLRASFRREPPDRFVEKLRLLGGAETAEAGRFLGRYRAANLERFHRELAERLSAGDEPSEVLRHLRRAVAEEREVERGLGESGLDAVQVLSIHGAKGLQFPHVYVLQLHKGSGGTKRDTEVLEFGQARGFRLLGAPDPGFAALDAARDEREAAERVRLLYVATTRPKRRLVLSGLQSGVAGAWQTQSPAQDLADRRESEAADGALRAALATGGRHVDADGVAWCFPALLQAAHDAPPPAAAAALPSLEQIRSEWQRLAQQRELAARREARRVSTAASAVSHEALHERFERPEPAGEREDEEREPSAEAAATRDDALAIGSALHRALEVADLAASPAEALPSASAAALGALRALLPADRATALEGEVVGLLRMVVSGDLFARLRSIEARGDLVARELPVLLRPADATGDPVGFVAGAIDLLYRDGKGYVIADYKTDRIGTDDEIRERIAAYARQGAAYRRAVQEHFRLDRPPRFELWFLRTGDVVPVEPVPAAD